MKMIRTLKETCIHNGGTTEACKQCDAIQSNSVAQMDVSKFLKCFENNSIDAIITDPPYNWSFMQREWDQIGTNEQYYEWAKQWGTELYRTLKEGGSAFVFGGKRTYHWLAQALKDAGFQQHDALLWIYWSGFPKGKYNLKPASEFVFHGVKNPAHKPLTEIGFTFHPEAIRVNGENTDEHYPANVFDIPKASKNEKTSNGKVSNSHPTVKPVKLLKQLIRLSTNEGDIVVDPFVGSGSTTVAAKELCREFIGNDNDAKSVETARQRVRLSPSECKNHKD